MTISSRTETMDRICVYCGSRSGRDSRHREQVVAFGRELVERDLGLVYGGGGVGLMGALADGFAALAGGLGTLDELFEVLTWAQLGIHDSPCGILNVAGYYDGLLAFLDTAVAEGFVPEEHRALLTVSDDPGELIDDFEGFTRRSGP